MEERNTDLLAALRAGWWIVPVVMAAALGGAAMLGSEQEPVYRAEATLAVVRHPSIEDVGEVLRTIDVLNRRTMLATFARLPSSSRIRRQAAGELAGDALDPAAYRVDATVVPNTYLIRLVVRGPESEAAARVANVHARITAEQADGYYPTFALRLLDQAEPPAGPAARAEERPFLVAGILGLFLGLLAAYGVGRMRKS
jgi:uncharacterized protein involved in exopolysaccharide biosynthesis